MNKALNIMEAYRGDFPILAQKVNNKPVAYLDSASSAQKPHLFWTMERLILMLLKAF